ncbi:hypothetical protein JKG47_05055 [Acidithiobacillus sp. MC6.1]|nr:hypothetical protein [Acidithiobacillus sp. MC6.1]
MRLQCQNRRDRAINLGIKFSQSFDVESKNLAKPGEVSLFRAMERALRSVAQPPNIIVEEYHGTNHLVEFYGSGPYSRYKVRCEISDLMVIVYDKKERHARLSYIQAKFERKVTSLPSGNANCKLAANLEQWDLLANRPLITGVGHFKPPEKLLSSAWLDSVGSFVFFLNSRSRFDIYYATASQLVMPFNYTQRNGKLTAVGDRCRGGQFSECRSVYGTEKFGACLFGQMIGTPIIYCGLSWSQDRNCSTWLATQLRGFASQVTEPEHGGDLAREIAQLLDANGDTAQSPNVGAASLVIIAVSGE